jgi:hypothetical protein
VLDHAADWFGGHGVDVYSNGCGDCFPANVGADYGDPRWQCTNLVNRFVHAENFGPTIGGNANGMYDSAAGMPAYYEVHRNGSGYVPVAGDIITFGSGIYGHVVVVSDVTATEVLYEEQNASPSGNGFITRHGSSLSDYGGYMPVIGIIHAKANDNSPRSTAAPLGAANPSTATSFVDSAGNYNVFVTTSGGINHYEKSPGGSWGGEVVATGSFNPGLATFVDSAGNYNVFVTTSGGINHYEKSPGGSWGGEVVAPT